MLLCCSSNSQQDVALVDCWPANFQPCPQPVPDRHNHREKALVSHFVVVYSTYVFIGQGGTMQAGPALTVSAKCPAVHSLLCRLCGSSSSRFYPFDPLVFSNHDVAALCPEITRVTQRAEYSFLLFQSLPHTNGTWLQSLMYRVLHLSNYCIRVSSCICLTQHLLHFLLISCGRFMINSCDGWVVRCRKLLFVMTSLPMHRTF